ncbi:MAG TPA: 3'-5' exonuclease, partial [Candidatus Hodarchaeales archaeon]|nr:3'-5' exonuclease [Candidatus Hodarchaeales archaeon]
MKGWILDVYPGNPGEIVVWIKREDSNAIRFVDKWTPSIFVATDEASDLQSLSKQPFIEQYVSNFRFVEKTEKITDLKKTKVLEINLKDAKKIGDVAQKIERLKTFGTYLIYNADVPPAQTYLYEHDLFPLAFCEVKESSGELEWHLLDDVWSYDYSLPQLRLCRVSVVVDKRGKLPKITDALGSVVVTGNDREIIIEDDSEEKKIVELTRSIRELDPDIIMNSGGDSFLFPYLINRAKVNNIVLSIDRDGSLLKLPARSGVSYFSYGRILFRPSTIRLYGRIHLDLRNTFAWGESDMEGLFELSRICRMPLHT